MLAARGKALRGLLADHAAEGGTGFYDFALTTQRRLEALLRHHDEAGLCARIATGMSDWDPALSARNGATPWQRRSLAGCGAALSIASVAATDLTRLAVAAALFIVFAAAVAQRLIVVAAAARAKPSSASPRLPDRDLPTFTIVVPLFREARVLGQLVRALDALDYPALCRKRNKYHSMRCIRHHL